MWSYRYYEGAEGRRYCYASQRTHRCPVAPPMDGALTGRVAEIAAVLDGLGLDGAKTLRRAHRTSTHVTEKTCGCCGAVLESLGYAVWIEMPWDQIPETNDNIRATRAINERMGSTHGRKPGSHRYFGLKREAIQWCREEAQIDKAAFRAALP